LNTLLHKQVSVLLRKVSDEIIIPHYKSLKTSDIEEKSPGDLVTIADKLSEEMLSEALSNILPSAKIVGEEACYANPDLLDYLNDDQCWIIDPIDGTGNYACGDGPFGIIIALTEHNQTIAAWLYDPINQRLCHAFKGQGSFINEQRIVTPQKVKGLPIAALATGYMSEDKRKDIISKTKGRYEIVPIPMCAAEQYPRLVLGQNHISIFERVLAWDHAAAILFLNEAGGKAARFDGNEYRPADRSIGLLGASNPHLWEQAAEIFKS